MSNVTKLPGSDLSFQGQGDMTAFLKKKMEETALTLLWLQQKCTALGSSSSDKIFTSALLELVRISREVPFEELMQSLQDPFKDKQ